MHYARIVHMQLVGSGRLQLVAVHRSLSYAHTDRRRILSLVKPTRGMGLGAHSGGGVASTCTLTCGLHVVTRHTVVIVHTCITLSLPIFTVKAPHEQCLPTTGPGVATELHFCLAKTAAEDVVAL